MIRLEPMTEAEFQAFLQPAIAEYAAEHVRGGRWSPEESLEESRKEYKQLLPDGLHTAKQHLFSIRDDAGAKVGMIWFAERELGANRTAFIYDIRIEAAFQRRGYATQAFRVLEPLVRSMGMSAISLHVFGHNTAARALYEKLGFETTNVLMTKTIADSTLNS
jgi:ribosomal protein S18 acetylase RimI-like enzyme